LSEECLNLLEAYKPKRMEGGGLKSGESGDKRGLWLCPKENKPCSVWVLPLVLGGKPQHVSLLSLVPSQKEAPTQPSITCPLP